MISRHSNNSFPRAASVKLDLGPRLRAVHSLTFDILLRNFKYWKFRRHDPTWRRSWDDCVLGEISYTAVFSQKILVGIQ